MNRFRLRHVVLPSLLPALLALLLLSACHRADGPVEYDGGTLAVDGQSYPAERHGPGEFAKGVALVFVKPGQTAGVQAALDRFGLQVIERRAGDVLAVKVPEGYELQWLSALSKLPQVQTTGTEDPTYRAP
ncbi:MAG: hypothetical protein ACTHOH_15720 [Lysobacteraceae bacterium]